MLRARSVIAALCASATVLACGPGTLVPGATEPPSSSGSRADINSRELALGAQLASLRGQNLVAVELVKRNQSAEALLVLRRARDYARFPFQSPVGSNGESAFTPLNQAIDAATTRLRRGDGGAALTEALVSVGRETLRIESETVGETTELAAYRASVVSSLAYGAGLYYQFAVLANPFDPGAYRAAYGFLREAQNIHAGLSTVIEEQTSDHARAADTLLAAMFGVMPSSEVPLDLPPSEGVEAAAYILGALLADDHGAVSPPPRNRLAFIPPLLDEALGAYESGEAGVADVLVQKVRESLCCPQTSAGDALETELALLSNAIRSGAADSDVETLVERSSKLAEDAA